MFKRIRRRRNESSPNRRPRMLGFQRLETRQLLAADILTIPVFDASEPVADVATDVAQNQNAADSEPSSGCECNAPCFISASGNNPFCPSRNRGLRAERGGHDGSIDPVSHPDKFRDPGHQGSTGSSIDPLSDPSHFSHPDHQQPNRGSIDPVSHPDKFKNLEQQQSQQLPSGRVGPVENVRPGPDANPEDGARGEQPIELPPNPGLRRVPLPRPPANSNSGSIDPISNPEKFTHRDHHVGLTNQPNPAPQPDLGQNLPDPDDYFEELGRESGLQQDEPWELPPPPNFQSEGIPLPEHTAPNPFGGTPASLFGPKGEVEFGAIRDAFGSILTTTDLAEQVTRALQIKLLRSHGGLKSPFVTTRGN